MRCYGLVHNIAQKHMHAMQATREEKDGFAVGKINVLKTETLTDKEDHSYGQAHDEKNLFQQITATFVKTEQDNDEMIRRIKNPAINKIISSMLQAEKSSDAWVEEMVSPLKYKSHLLGGTTCGLNILSFELASQLK